MPQNTTKTIETRKSLTAKGVALRSVPEAVKGFLFSI